MQVARDQITLPIDTGNASYSVDVMYAENANNKSDDSNQLNDDNSNQSKDDDTNQPNGDNANQPNDDNANQPNDDNANQPNDDNANQPNDDNANQPNDSNTVRKRINTLTKKWRTAEREVVALKHENSKLRKPSGTLLAEPQVDTFEDANDYMAAMVDWKIQQSQITSSASNVADLEAQIDDKSKSILKEKQVYLDQAFTLAETKYKDFNQVFNDNIPISTSMVDSLLCLDNIGDVAYYLGKHITETTDISKLSKIEAAMALQRISSKLGVKRVSNGPKPISPTRGSRQDKNLDSMSFAEYRKEMTKREQLKLQM